MTVGIHKHVWPKAQKDILHEFGPAQKRAQGILRAALQRLERSDNPGSEQPCKAPLRRFYRCIDQFDGQWLWVYFGVRPGLNQPYLVVALQRVHSVPGSHSPPPDPPITVWEVGKERFFRPE